MAHLCVLGLLFARFVAADIPNKITISTECKTCPYSLCTNKKIYDSNKPNMTLTCWAEGTGIVGDTTWLKTNDDCYVTQYDLDEYAGDYTEDLPFCGYIEPAWTLGTGHTKYYSDCYIAPYMRDDPIKRYKYGINLDLTCVMPNITQRAGDIDTTYSTVLGKAKWYKTTSNCYVHETTLDRVRDESDLDDCGPIEPYLAATDHLPEPTTSTAPIPSTTTVPTTQPPTQITTTIPVPFPTPSNATVLRRAPVNLAPRHKLDRRLLWNTYIGEEYVNCTTGNSFTDRAHGIKRVYEYNQTVTPQCGTVVGDKEDIMLFTTDFCWIKDDEVDPQLRDSLFRLNQFFRCESYTDVVT